MGSKGGRDSPVERDTLNNFHLCKVDSEKRILGLLLMSTQNVSNGMTMAKIPNVMRWKFSSMLIFLFACRCNPDATGEKEAGWAALGRWEMAGKRQKLRSGEIKYVFLWYVKHQYFYSQIIFSPCLATTPSEDPEDWGDISRTFILCHFTIDFVLNVTRFFFVCPRDKKTSPEKHLWVKHGTIHNFYPAISFDADFLIELPTLGDITFLDEIYVDMFV